MISEGWLVPNSESCHFKEIHLTFLHSSCQGNIHTQACHVTKWCDQIGCQCGRVRSGQEKEMTPSLFACERINLPCFMTCGVDTKVM